MFMTAEKSDCDKDFDIMVWSCRNSDVLVVELKTGVALVAGSTTPIMSFCETKMKSESSKVSSTQNTLANVATGTRVKVRLLPLVNL